MTGAQSFQRLAGLTAILASVLAVASLWVGLAGHDYELDAFAGAEAILGAGAQAESHLDALALVREFDDIRVWNRSPERAVALADKAGGRATGAEQAVRGADVVIATTASSEPVLRAPE